MLPSDPTRKRYDRLALVYNLLEAPLEHFGFASWRERLRERITGKRVLEAGVGTGKNLIYYPEKTEITGIDFSPAMLKRARKMAAREHIEATLLEMDVQRLDFPDNHFDTVVATFVFCSVPDPVSGLRELRRVCKAGGRLLLLEHVRPENAMEGFLFDLLNPFVVRLMGANINRRTLENVKSAGWKIRKMEKMFSDIVWWVEAEPSGG